MASLGKKEREKLLNREAEKFLEKRNSARKAKRDISLGMDERIAASKAMQSLPRRSMKIRSQNRCSLTGNSRGFFRKTGLGRHAFREFALRGLIPGWYKASW